LFNHLLFLSIVLILYEFGFVGNFHSKKLFIQAPSTVCRALFPVDTPDHLPLENLEQISFDTMDFAQAAPLPPQINKNVLDAILKDVLIFGKLRSILK